MAEQKFFATNQSHLDALNGMDADLAALAVAAARAEKGFTGWNDETAAQLRTYIGDLNTAATAIKQALQAVEEIAGLHNQRSQA